MKIYAPNQLTFDESQKYTAEQAVSSVQNKVTDDDLVKYAVKFIEIFRRTFEDFFPEIAPHISTYAVYPIKTNIVRMDQTGIFILHQKSEENEVEIFDFDKLSPPVEANLFDIQKRFDPCWGEFDFSGRSFSLEEAEIKGKSYALDTALHVFWLLLDSKEFQDVCLRLIEAEAGIKAEIHEHRELDVQSRIVIDEYAGFRREENWAFEFKHFKENRVTADIISKAEALLDDPELDLDVICLVTSGDITSIGKSFVIRNPKIRVWDRQVLNYLFHKHSELLGDFFTDYEIAAEFISAQIAKLTSSRYKEFEKRLKECPAGQKGFKQYEKLCSEILQYNFEGKLKHIKDQKSTDDGSQIRDTIFRNLRVGDLFDRIFSRFDADFIVFDPKNYSDQITKTEVDSISKYASPAIGRFVVLISPKGADDATAKTQHRIFNTDKKVILSISNADLLEMIERKERGENPEDLLDDLLDKMLLGV